MIDIHRDADDANARILGHQGLRLVQYLSRVRQLSGYSGEEIAEIAGITSGELSDIEVGDTSPDLRTLLRIAHAVGVSIQISAGTIERPDRAIPLATEKTPL